MIWSSRTITQPTIGFGLVEYRPCAASSSARRMNSSSFTDGILSAQTKGPAESRPLHRLRSMKSLLRGNLHRAVARHRLAGARRSADVHADPLSRLEAVDHV